MGGIDLQIQLYFVMWLYSNQSDYKTRLTSSSVECELFLLGSCKGTSKNFGQSVCLKIPPSDNSRLKSNLQ